MWKYQIFWRIIKEVKKWKSLPHKVWNFKNVKTTSPYKKCVGCIMHSMGWNNQVESRLINLIKPTWLLISKIWILVHVFIYEEMLINDLIINSAYLVDLLLTSRNTNFSWKINERLLGRFRMKDVGPIGNCLGIVFKR